MAASSPKAAGMTNTIHSTQVLDVVVRSLQRLGQRRPLVGIGLPAKLDGQAAGGINDDED